MYTDTDSAQLKRANGSNKDFDKPFVEDSYSVREYACMYYMMTPTGCNHTDRSRFLEK